MCKFTKLSKFCSQLTVLTDTCNVLQTVIWLSVHYIFLFHFTVTKEDVKYSTSLPPAVEGQLRCFLRVSVTKIDWMVAKPPDVTQVRLCWWGDHSDGTVFRYTGHPKKTQIF